MECIDLYVQRDLKIKITEIVEYSDTCISTLAFKLSVLHDVIGMYAKMDKNQNSTASGHNDKKQMGCWAKFQRFFDARGFDLEYEYNATNQINILGENQNDIEGYGRISDRKSVGKRPVVENPDRSS